MLFVLVALWVVWPVMKAPTELALGHPGNDVWNHVWGYMYVADKLLSAELPIHSDLVSWPAGGSLWFIDSFGALLTLPLNWAFGPVLAYNAYVFLAFVIAGVGAYGLAWVLTRSLSGALVAGLAFQTAPHLLAQTYNGISETLSVGWFALSVAGFHWASADPTRRRVLVAGAMWGVCAVANWYYGMFAGFFLLASMITWGRRAVQLRRRDGHWPPVMGQHIRRLIEGGLALLVVSVGPFLLFMASMHADDAVVTRDPGFVYHTLVLHNMTDLVALFHPGKFYSPDLKSLMDEDLIVVVYLGHALLWPALWVFFTPYHRLARQWAVLGFLFFVMTLGAFLYVDGDYVSVGEGWVPLPFLAFFKWFPLFSRISHAYRFAIPATLVLAVMVAWTVRHLVERGRPAWLVVGVLCTLRIGESFWGSAAVFPVPVADFAVHPIYSQLDDGAVLDLPVSLPVLARSQYNAPQIIHKQPIPYGLNDPSPLFLYLNRYTRYLIELERSPVDTLPPTLPAADLALGRTVLVDSGMRWIVVHRELYPDRLRTKIERFLDMTATPVFADSDVRVYRLDPEVADAQSM
jgi:hypothetical protein